MKKDKQRIAIAEACGLGECGVDELPDYLNDLNAMHEAEAALDLVARRKFRDILSRHTIPKLAAIHATAAQRAEAFLRTIGKWEDEP